MTQGSLFADSLKPVVDLVYPPRCPLCGIAVAQQGGVCSDCWSDFEFPADPGPDADIYAATYYNDASRRLVLAFKHGGKISLAKLLGRLMAARLPSPDEKNRPLIIPVPLHRWRLWSRGYNQSALLAREIARAGKGDLLVDGLVRRKRTPSLGGLNSDQRRKVLEGAIEVRQSRLGSIGERDVVLVDDVLTSGATSNACIAALANAGVRSVKLVCFAQAGRGERRDQEQDEETTKTKSITPEAYSAPGAT